MLNSENQPITIITGKQYDETISASIHKDGLSPYEILALFKSVFLGFSYTHEQWEQAITNEIENF